MGFFRIGTHRGRDCLVDPQGNPFFSLGIVHAAAYPEGEGQVLFGSKYAGNWTILAAKIAADFAHWGFNTAGYHSPLAMVPHLPFMVDSYPANISYWMGKPVYPDVFDPGYRRRVEDHKQGLLRANESPYTILIEQVRRTNREILEAFRER